MKRRLVCVSFDFDAIKALTGGPARGYPSPSRDLSVHSVELLFAHGFVYDSSMMGHDRTTVARLKRG